MPLCEVENSPYRRRLSHFMKNSLIFKHFKAILLILISIDEKTKLSEAAIDKMKHRVHLNRAYTYAHTYIPVCSSRVVSIVVTNQKDSLDFQRNSYHARTGNFLQP